MFSHTSPSPCLLGAYHAFKEDLDDKLSEQFCAEDIENILERSSRTIQHSTSSETGSTFSKASFVVSEKGGVVYFLFVLLFLLNARL